MERNTPRSRVDERAQIIAQRDVFEFSLIEASYPPTLRISNHSHEIANFCIAFSGTCTEFYGRKRREYKPLSLDYLPAEHIHSLTFGTVPLRCFTVNVNPHLLNTLRGYSLSLDESLHCHGGSLAWLFMKIYNEFIQRDTASSVAIEGLMLELLAAVSRRQIGIAEMRPPRWLRNVREILHSRFQEDLRLLALSEEAGVHPVHLCREFRRYYQQTVGEYVRKLRIDYACQQMSNPEISLGEIASAAGFADHSHFSRTFKRFIGMPPAAFRSNLFGR